MTIFIVWIRKDDKVFLLHKTQIRIYSGWVNVCPPMVTRRLYPVNCRWHQYISIHMVMLRIYFLGWNIFSHLLLLLSLRNTIMSLVHAKFEIRISKKVSFFSIKLLLDQHRTLILEYHSQIHKTIPLLTNTATRRVHPLQKTDRRTLHTISGSGYQ